MAKTPVYLITGFLGSGKTTFIKGAIDFLTPSLKVAVVQNEFAPGDIDGQELKRTTTKHFDLLEINNGSVFCLCLLSSFIKSLSEFARMYPADIILLEASGLSDPIAVGQVFNSPELQQEVYLAGNICVVDAKRFEEQKVLLPRVQHQVMIADHILINKTDEVGDLPLIDEVVKALNPYGKRLNATFCQTDFELIFDRTNSDRKGGRHLFLPEGGKPDVQSAVYRSTIRMGAENLAPFLDVVTRNTWRLKGYIILDNGKCMAVQAVMGDYTFEEMNNGNSQTEIVVISQNIDASLLKLAYQKFTR